MWDIPAGDCDCDGTSSTPWACGGDCAEDADADGICDDVDDCVGALDACGVCNGPGEIYECGCADIPEGDCDCGRQPARRSWRVAVTAEDADADGICDDVDDCVGALDACGVCNGPGEIYECGCADIPQATATAMATSSTPLVRGGDWLKTPMPMASATTWTTAWARSTLVASATDQERSTSADVPTSLQATATAMATSSTLLESVAVTALKTPMPMASATTWMSVGELDACGVCNGPGEIYECGCADIPAGDCDCDGNQLDALGEWR